MSDQNELFRFVQLRELNQPKPAGGAPDRESTPEHRPDGHTDSIADGADDVIIVSSPAIDALSKTDGSQQNAAEILQRARAVEKQMRPFFQSARRIRKNGIGDLNALREAAQAAEKKLGIEFLNQIDERASLALAAARMTRSSTTSAAVLEDVIRGSAMARALLDPKTIAAQIEALSRAEVVIKPHDGVSTEIVRRAQASTRLHSSAAAMTVADKSESSWDIESSTSGARRSLLGGDRKPKLVPWAGGFLSKDSGASTTGWQSGQSGIPTTIGAVRTLSIGDLYVADVASVRYEFADIAHIENVLQTEKRSRTHRMTETVETFVASESESYERTMSELQTTENFELQQAIQSVTSSSTALSASFGATAGYGPVSVSAGFGLDNTSSRSNSTQRAMNFAREVLEKSATEVSKRVQTERSTRTSVEVVDENLHGFDNTHGENHVVGIYRYLDKIVTSKITNYGARLMLELIVPEPAAVLAHALGESGAASAGIEMPDEFTLLPSQINEANYQNEAARYGVRSIPPPPPQWTVITHAVAIRPADAEDFADPERARDPDPDASQPERAYFSGSHKFDSLPEGYKPSTIDCVAAFATLSTSGSTRDYVRFSIGNKSGMVLADANDTLRLTQRIQIGNGLSQAGELSVVWAGRTKRGIGLSFTIRCIRTTEALNNWRMQAWTAIDEAYQAKVRANENQIAHSLAVNRSYGTNPRLLREIEKTELKRSALTLLTDQDFSFFGSVRHAINGGADDHPSIDTAEARLEGEYIRFFEQAVEWKNSVHELYDYMWAGRHRWNELLARSSTDTEHQAFLRAGAAKLVLPVKPGFEVAMLNFLDTGKLWDGESKIELPSGHALGNEIERLIAEPRDRSTEDTGTETIRVPTNLVILQMGPDPNQAALVGPIVTPVTPEPPSLSG